MLHMRERSQSALIAIRRILRVAEITSRDVSERTGLTPSQIVVLQIIAHEGPSGAGAVADAARLSPATVTAMLDRLEERSLVRRVRDPDDRRRVTIELTDAGRSAVAEAPDVLQNRFVARFDRLADWEQAMMIATLERLAVLLDAEGIDASPMLDVGRLDRSPQ
jgi:DNA-binding MarR family transcriptional regulator